MKEINEWLKKRGIRNAVLREEYLDHYMSQLESGAEGDKSFQQALKEVKSSIDRLNGNAIVWSYYSIHYKNKFMMVITILALFSFFNLPFVSENEPPSIAPVEGHNYLISSTFGNRVHPKSKMVKFHKGLDIKGSLGDKIVAPSGGIISETGFKEGIGHYIVIKHDEVYSSRYHHLSKIAVSKNHKVNIGDKIGEIGTSGWSSGPHLHYEVLKNGKNVDPALFLGA